MTPVVSDERLVRRATKGDEKAFAAIFSRYHRDLYRFCLAIVRTPEDAQDALQNAMVKVLRALPGEQRPIQLKPWLYRIAHNEAIEVLRRRRESVELDPELHASGTGPVETAAGRERLRGLLDDLGALPERQRAALVMRELGDLGFAEIAATFETSEGVVRQTVYEARLGLRQMEAGREMNCESVMQQLSDADGRVTRRRDVKAHLRACPNCSAFRDGIGERRHDFAAIAPLPLAASMALLQGVLGASGAGAAAAGAGAVGSATGAAAGVGGTAGGAAAGAGGAAAGGGAAGAAGVAGAAGAGLAGSAIVKSAATVAVVAALGAGAADRGGLIETPLRLGGDGAKTSGPSEPGSAPAGATSGQDDPQPQADEAAERRLAPRGGPASNRGGLRKGLAASEGKRQPGARKGRGQRPDRGAVGAPGHAPSPGHGKRNAPGHGSEGSGVESPGGGKPDRAPGGGSAEGNTRGATPESRPPRKPHPGKSPKASGGTRQSAPPPAPTSNPEPEAAQTTPPLESPPLPSTDSGTAEGQISVPTG